MKIGYARVSTKEQNLNLQIEALEKAGYEIIFKKTISGATKVRPELDKMITQFRKGDELVVWRLDGFVKVNIYLQEKLTLSI